MDVRSDGEDAKVGDEKILTISGNLINKKCGILKRNLWSS